MNRSAFIPFSFGPYNCVGKSLAWIEMIGVISTVLRKFEFQLEEGFDAQKWEKGIVA
jgi:cytochrome P450